MEDGSAERRAAVAWKRTDSVCLERFELQRGASGWTLRGTIVLLHHGAPFEARYDGADVLPWPHDCRPRSGPLAVVPAVESPQP